MVAAVIAEARLPDGARQVRGGDGRVFWSTGGRVISWIEEWCVFTNGRWSGRPFVLLPWQKRLIWELFEIDPETGLRVYRRAIIGLPRKSGKTELAAALILYLLLADGEPAAQIYCAASSEDQADMVFRAAKRMCFEEGKGEDEQPLLYDLVTTTAASDRIIARDDPYAFIERLSSKGRTKHGLNVFVAVFDELHTWGAGENSELYAALTTGSAARLQPLQLAITTAGTDLDATRCAEMYRLGRRIQRGEVPPGGFFFRWWSAPDTQCMVCGSYAFDQDKCPRHPTAEMVRTDYREPALWRLASPSYGQIVTDGFYRDEVNSTTEADFRRLYLNQWVEAGSTPWLAPGKWAACDIGAFEMVPGAKTFVGVDLSETRDSTAVAWGQLAGDVLRVKVRTWERPVDAHGHPVAHWEVPQAEVKEFIRELNREYDVVSNVFDPWHSKLMRQDLEAEGMLCEEIWQTGSRRSGATSALFDRIVTRRLAHDGDPVLARHVANASTKTSGEGYYLAKRKKGATMDAAMALVNVVYGLTWAREKKNPVPNVWD